MTFYEKGVSALTFLLFCAGAAFVTPYTREVEETLRAAGMSRADFYVPFSNWDYPKFERERWMELWEKAKEACCRDFEADCAHIIDPQLAAQWDAI